MDVRESGSGIPGAEASRMLGLNASMAPAFRYHFSGIAGAGMNPLARLMRARGHEVQGSDRSFDSGKNRDLAARLRGLGIDLRPHDGKAVTDAIDRFVYSTAVEAGHAGVAGGHPPGPRAGAPAGAAGRGGQRGAARAWPSPAPAARARSPGWWRWLLRESRRDGDRARRRRRWPARAPTAASPPGPAEGPVVAEACESDGTLVGLPADRSASSTTSAATTPSSTSLRAQFAAFAAQLPAGCWSTPAAPRPPRSAVASRPCPTALAPGRRRRARGHRALGPDRAQGILRLSRRRALRSTCRSPACHNLENAAAAADRGARAGASIRDEVAAAARPLPRRGAPLRGGRRDHAVGHPGGGRLRPQRREAAGGAHHRAGRGPDGSWRSSSRTASGPRASCGPS